MNGTSHVRSASRSSPAPLKVTAAERPRRHRATMRRTLRGNSVQHRCTRVLTAQEICLCRGTLKLVNYYPDLLIRRIGSPKSRIQNGLKY